MSFFVRWERNHSDSLFDRIRHDGQASEQRKTVSALVESVRQHLELVLNTHPDSCQSAPGLGVEDLNGVTQNKRDIYSSICEAICQCVLCYEPRVSEVSISIPSSDSEELMDMLFRLLVTVRQDDLEQVVTFSIILQDNQHYRVA